MNLYLPQQVRDHERALFAGGVDSCALMEAAGAAAWARIRADCPGDAPLQVIVGPGNNGGDGLVIARLARAEGRVVRLLGIASLDDFKGDAATQAAAWRTAGGGEVLRDPGALRPEGVLVDALFGIGLDRALEGTAAEWVAAINRQALPVVSIDVPSGLDAATGHAPGPAVRADRTVTFIAAKVGLFTGDGCELAGRVALERLEMPEPEAPPVARVDEDVHGLPPRHRNAHKGRFGTVLVLGGNAGMSGAARLAGEGALRVGAGKVRVGTHPEHAAWLNQGRPELMVSAVADERALLRLLGHADVLALGPGLGQDAWAMRMVRQALRVHLPMVVDADALRLIGNNRSARHDIVFTPHPGEAAFMLEQTAGAIQADRPAAARRLQDTFGGVVVLKGAGTLVAGSDDLVVCPAGNPGMASGGMGDVLTGVIAGLMAQGLPPFEAARLGVRAHAEAADEQARAEGEVGLLASDLLPGIRRWLGRGAS
ncbi:MAG: NAD(P)H-hydrate dehydratase [Halothiobacillaceae bacterium]